MFASAVPDNDMYMSSFAILKRLNPIPVPASILAREFFDRLPENLTNNPLEKNVTDAYWLQKFHHYKGRVFDTAAAGRV